MIAQLFSTELAVVIPIVILALIAFAIVALVTARRDPDPAGTRPYAIYLVLIIFFSMFTALFALTAVASNVAKIPQSDGNCVPIGAGEIQCGSGQEVTITVPAVGSGNQPPTTQGTHGWVVSRFDPDKASTASAIEAAFVALVALLVLWFHVLRLRELVEEREFDRSPGRRTYQVYLHAVTFTSSAILIFSAAAALYALFRIAAPGYTDQLASSGAERDAGVVQLVSSVVLTAGAWLIFSYHWRRTRTLRGRTPLPPAARAAPPGPPPSAAPVQTEVPPPRPPTQTPAPERPTGDTEGGPIGEEPEAPPPVFPPG